MPRMDPQQTLQLRIEAVRQRSLSLCRPLAVEDMVPQPVAEISPPKWHLAHTSWFFETLLLQPGLAAYQVFHPGYAFLFNSYYQGLGERVQRQHRGALSRPTVAEVLAYRAHVDAGLAALLQQDLTSEQLALLELGLQHEQQHQELLLTDLKFILGTQPLAPAYDPTRVGALDLSAEHENQCPPLGEWHAWLGGMAEIGHQGPGFAFDNEQPRHPVWLPACELRANLVSNAEYLAFMQDGGYQRFELWHAEGWDWLQAQGVQAPLYWRIDADRPEQWQHYTLRGVEPLMPEAPVTHLSYYEAHAFCAWAGWRLPSEAEWEVLAPQFVWGRRWEWTASSYQPYPRFVPTQGAVAEYNGKFMVNQLVLRGASFATPPGHARQSYRNFFHAPTRWQYTGVRPARG